MGSRMMKSIAIMAVLLCASAGWAQKGGASIPNRPPGEVRGQVRMPDNQVSPNGLPVLLIYRSGEMVAQTQTDSSGKFEFRGLQPGYYRVRISATGYLPVETDDLNLVMSPMSYQIISLKADPNYRNPFAHDAPGGVVSAADLAAPEDARKDLESGKALLQKGSDYPKSIEFFKSAIKKYPKYSEAYLMMGLAYRAQNNLGDANNALRKCVEINANSAAAYIALGEVQNQQQDFTGAEKTLLKAVALSPESPQAQVELGRSQLAQKHFEDAEPHVMKALSLAPDNPSAHLLMGNLDMHKRNGQAALQEYRQYLKLDPAGAMAPAVTELVGKLERALGASAGQSQ